jgi:hypothetical protein
MRRVPVRVALSRFHLYEFGVDQELATGRSRANAPRPEFRGLAALLCLIVPASVAQVKITVSSRRYKAQEKICAKVQNTGNTSGTFWMAVGQTSSDKGGTGRAQLVINFRLVGDPARQRRVIYLPSRDK